MTNNDTLRRLRYALNIDDAKVAEIIAHTGRATTPDEVLNWLKREDEKGYTDLPHDLLCRFLDGLIIEKRGKKDGPQPPPETRLSNNIVFRKLKIALNLQAEDVLKILNQGDFRMSKHELSAFFRKPEHKHYRDCKDQVLRNFLKGVQVKYRA